MGNKIMFLGGSANSVELIEYANELGYETYLCDNTDCIGKKVAKHYYSTSAADVDGVVAIMKQENIDNLISYGNDILAAKQAEIATILNIKSNKLETVQILTQKDLFRQFLREHNFNEPYINTYTKDTFNVDDEDLQQFPIMIKPVDSAGSSGVTKVLNKDMLQEAFNYALKYSRSGKVIAEKFIVNKYPYMIEGDVFVNNGKVIFYGLMNELRDNPVNPFLPMGTFSHLFITEDEEKLVHSEIDRLVTDIGFEYGGMNVEIVIDITGKPYFIELAPRNGGNRISDQLEYSFGANVRKMLVDATLGKQLLPKDNKVKQLSAIYVIHTYKDGILKNININEKIKSKIVKEWNFVNIGEKVEYFANASKAIAFIMFDVDSVEELEWFLANHNSLINVEVE